MVISLTSMHWHYFEAKCFKGSRYQNTLYYFLCLLFPYYYNAIMNIQYFKRTEIVTLII
jgi:hypothetical protein